MSWAFAGEGASKAQEMQQEMQIDAKVRRGLPIVTPQERTDRFYRSRLEAADGSIGVSGFKRPPFRLGPCG
jgi:hypothetical protein